MSEIIIEQITTADISDKVKWYNDSEVTKYLYYEENFTEEKTLEWLTGIEKDTTRYENVIKFKVDGQYRNIGIIGLFNIDKKNRKAGFYITIGELDYQGKGLAKKSTIMFLRECFIEFNLEKIYLFTDKENVAAQKLYEKIGFKKEGILRSELLYKEQFIDRCYYGILRDEYFSKYTY